MHKKSTSIQKSFQLGELFCGPGGLAYGALQTKVIKGKTAHLIKHAWANDYDPDSCKTYIRNICPDEYTTVICQDVRELKFNRLPLIDAFAYGFPCNDFSVVGEQKGFNGNFGPLYSYGVKIIDFFKPKFFVAENVGGIASANDGSAFKKILADLKNAGNEYVLTTHLYKFEEYGVPQTRHRVIIVGIAKPLGLLFRVPAPTTVRKFVSAKEALEQPPIPADCPNSEITAQSQTVIERLKHIKAGENAWNADLPVHLRLNVKKTRLSHIYKRLHPDRPSYTLTGSGGGGTHCYHWSQPRALTNRERARLQTFPDHYIFSGYKESVRKQIGMAVPPKMSEIIFNSVLKTLAGIEYPFVMPNIETESDLFELCA